MPNFQDRCMCNNCCRNTFMIGIFMSIANILPISTISKLHHCYNNVLLLLKNLIHSVNFAIVLICKQIFISTYLDVKNHQKDITNVLMDSIKIYQKLGDNCNIYHGRKKLMKQWIRIIMNYPLMWILAFNRWKTTTTVISTRPQ